METASDWQVLNGWNMPEAHFNNRLQEWLVGLILVASCVFVLWYMMVYGTLNALPPQIHLGWLEGHSLMIFGHPALRSWTG